MLVRIGWVALGVLLLLLLVVLGPAWIRRDVLRLAWAGATGEGALEAPIGIALGDRQLFVSDAATNRIVVFDTSGSVLAVWPESTTGLERPMHLSRGPDGLLYVAEYLTDRVTALDSAGRPVRRIGGVTGSSVGELDAPGGAASLEGAVFVADFFNHRVQAFSSDTVRVVGRAGRLRGGRLHYPTDVAAGDSLLYVADAYNHRVQVFGPRGDYVRRWGGPLGLGIPGPFKGWFRVATGVHVAGGRVYVADFYNHRIQIFSENGRYLGAVRDSLRLPTDVAVADDGTVYVVDFGHQRVVRFGPVAASR